MFLNPAGSKTLQVAWAIPLQSGRVHAVASQGKSCVRPYSLQQGESGISRGKWYRQLVVSSHLIPILKKYHISQIGSFPQVKNNKSLKQPPRNMLKPIKPF